MRDNTKLTETEVLKRNRYLRKVSIFWDLPYEEKLHFWKICVERTPDHNHLLLYPLKFFYSGAAEVLEVMNYEGKKECRDNFDNLMSKFDYLHIIPNLHKELGIKEVKPFLDWLIKVHEYTAEDIEIEVEKRIAHVPKEYRAEKLREFINSAYAKLNPEFEMHEHSLSYQRGIGHSYAKYRDTSELREVFFAAFGDIHVKEQTGHEPRLASFLKGYRCFWEIKVCEMFLEEYPDATLKGVLQDPTQEKSAGLNYVVFYELGIIEHLTQKGLTPKQIQVFIAELCGKKWRTYAKLARDIKNTKGERYCCDDYPIPNRENRENREKIDKIYTAMKYSILKEEKLPIVPRKTPLK